jgi:hypothetical protein
MLPEKGTMNRKYKNTRHTCTPNTECTICKKPIYVIPSRLSQEKNCCSISCRNKWFSKEKSPRWKGGVRNKLQSRKSERDRKERNKKHVMKYLGGKCCLCGYNKSYSAMDFHHVNPLEKSTAIKNISSCSLEKILTEAKKCVLLCSNCHREYHHTQIHNHEKYIKTTKIIKKDHETRTTRKTI